MTEIAQNAMVCLNYNIMPAIETLQTDNAEENNDEE